MPSKITAESLWIEALMTREDLFDRLMALDGHGAKFRRVLLAESLARHLSLADVAALIGTTATDLLALVRGDAIVELTRYW